MITPEKKTFIEALRLLIANEDLHLHDLECEKAETNTLQVNVEVLGVAYPRNIDELRSIAKVANEFGVSIYPVSQGKNIGYGEMTPTGSLQLVVGLKHLNSIREFDAKNGEVVIEPGVTQSQLVTYLKAKGAKYWTDVTGANPETSLIGNALEAGFGHTPLGDHRKHIIQMEVMLVDGRLLETSEMPAIGPDLTQLFVQSNFAIVTAMRIPLFPIPEETLTFTVSFANDADFFSGIEILAALRKDETITSLAHTGNSTRILMTSSRFPEDIDRHIVLTEKDSYEILNQKSPLDFGMWTTIGGLYGYKEDVKNKKKRLKAALKKFGNIRFFSAKKIKIIDNLLNSKWSKRLKYLDFVRDSFSSLKSLHGLICGEPSTKPSDNIFWRVNELKNLGLIWHAPVIPATNKDCKALLEVTRLIYMTHRFEMPVTLTLINAKHLMAVFNINFDKSNVEESARAQQAFRDLNLATTLLGYYPYRCGLLNQPSQYYSEVQMDCLNKIKSAFDPRGILAPGRYGIVGINKAN